MSWNIKTPGDYINGPLTVAGVTQFNSNVGVGVAPSAGSTYKVIQGGGGIVFGSQGTQSNFTENAYLAGAGTWTYATNAAASLYQQTGGTHTWYRTSAGTGNIAWTQAMTLDGSGRLCVGAISPSSSLHVNSNGFASGAGWTSIGRFNNVAQSKGVDLGYNPGNDNATITALSAGGASGFEFWNFNSGWAARFAINPNGVAVLNGGNSAANGVGIAFPSAQSASTDANTLDDYEEGTWTVGLSDLFGNDATVSAQTGRYVKIGRRVFCYATITLSNKGAGSAGNLPYIIGLPFQAARAEGSVVQFYANTSLTTNGQINFQTAPSNNVGNFTVSSSTTGTTFLTFAQITNTTQFNFCFSYDV
jgi:hypothetical protein